jgi:hypothetical protein
MSIGLNRLLGWCVIPLAVMVAACGSGDSPTPSVSPSPTGPHASFIAAADRECAAVHRTLDARPQPSALDQIVPYLDATIAADTELERKLRALTPPPQDATAVSTLLDDFQDLLTRAGAARQIAAGGDLVAADKALGDLAVQVATVNAKARRFGFTSCGIAPKPKAQPSSS